MQRVGRELGRVPLGGAEPAELIGDLIGPDARRLEQRRASHERHDRAPRGYRRAAAVGVEAGVGDPALPAVLVQRSEMRIEVAARGSARGAR